MYRGASGFVVKEDCMSSCDFKLLLLRVPLSFIYLAAVLFRVMVRVLHVI